MKMFEKAFIFKNEKKPETLKAVEILRKKLTSRNVKIVKVNEVDEHTIAFILGGDGTVLKASKMLKGKKASMVGINFGHLGFLSPYDFKEIDKVLEELSSGEYRVVRRSFLKVKYEGEERECLNDFVIQRAVPSHMLKIAVKIAGSEMGKMLCDGMIFSTSTGSTAYNLSAGGAVIDPNLTLISIVPMLAHAFATWPMVTSFDRKLEIEVEPREYEAYFCVGDGETWCKMTKKSSFEITGSEEYLDFLCTHNMNFFELVHTKLGWGFHNGIGGKNGVEM